MEKYCTARRATDYNTIRCMSFACWIPKAPDTHLEYVILIAFPLQQQLHERASMLRYTYIAFLVWIYCRVRHATSATSPTVLRSGWSNPRAVAIKRVHDCWNDSGVPLIFR